MEAGVLGAPAYPCVWYVIRTGIDFILNLGLGRLCSMDMIEFYQSVF
jgi:hypothetical protein